MITITRIDGRRFPMAMPSIAINRVVFAALLLASLTGGITAADAKSRGSSAPDVRSAKALVVDAVTGEPIYAKNSDRRTPIASVTKLMTAMVVLDAELPLDEMLTVGRADIDTLRGSRSRLRPGTRLTRRELLLLALMSSENRAASALGRHYPGGISAFVSAMNRKARRLGMTKTRFVDSTGLSAGNVSTAADLVKMVKGASRYALIREFTTTDEHSVETRRGRRLDYRNTNALVRKDDWDIDVSKTGYINEAGRCLVMKTRVGDRPVFMVLLDAFGKYTPMADAKRVKRWVLARPGRRTSGTVAGK